MRERNRDSRRRKKAMMSLVIIVAVASERVIRRATGSGKGGTGIVERTKEDISKQNLRR